MSAIANSNQVPAPQGAPAEMAVQFSSAVEEPQTEKRSFLMCLLDTLFPHHHHNNRCCYDECDYCDDRCSPRCDCCDAGCGGRCCNDGWHGSWKACERAPSQDYDGSLRAGYNDRYCDSCGTNDCYCDSYDDRYGYRGGDCGCQGPDYCDNCYGGRDGYGYGYRDGYDCGCDGGDCYHRRDDFVKREVAKVVPPKPDALQRREETNVAVNLHIPKALIGVALAVASGFAFQNIV